MKRLDALKELENSPPLIALVFKNKKRFGVLFATKTQSLAPRLLGVNIPLSPSGVGITQDEEAPGRGIACIFAGIGNTGELVKLFEYFKNCFMEEHSVLGLHNRITIQSISRLVALMNEEFRSSDYDIGYSVEIIIVNFLKVLEIFRIKHDGDFHYAMPYCIIGGYGTRRGGRESVRKYALAEFKKVYCEKLPSLDQARKLAKRVLAVDKNPGRYQENVIDWISANNL